MAVGKILHVLIAVIYFSCVGDVEMIFVRFLWERSVMSVSIQHTKCDK